MQNRDEGRKEEKKVVITYNYNDVPTVRAFTNDRAEVKAIMGPFGSGKSTGCVMDLLNKSFRQEPNKQGIRKTRWAIVRNTYSQLKDTTKKTIDEWLTFAKWREYDHTFTINVKAEDGTTVYSEWMLRALDRPDQVENLLSYEITGAWLNEARQIPLAIFEGMQGRIGRYPKMTDAKPTWKGIILDTNPPDQESWFFKYFEELQPKMCFKCTDRKGSPIVFETPKGCPICKSFEGVPYAVLYKQPSGRGDQAENIQNLPDGYYTNLVVGKDEGYVKAYIDGEYAYMRDGKPVFSSYNEGKHLAKENLNPIKGIGIVIGLDCSGLTPAAVFTQVDHRGRMLVLDEIFFEDACIDIREFAKSFIKPKLMTKYLGYNYTIIGDPAGNQRSQIDKATVYQELKAQGLTNVRPSPTNLLFPRITAVNNFLNKTVGETSGFYLSPHCKYLRKAMLGEYKLRRLRVSDEKFAELPDKNWASHLADALEYAALGYDTVMSAKHTLGDSSSSQGKEVSSKAWT